MISVIFVALMLFVLFYPPAVLAMNCMKGLLKKKKLTAGEAIGACVPFLNLVKIRKLFYGTAKSVIFAIIIILTLVLYRMLAIFVLYINEWVVLISTVAMLLAMVLIWLVSAFVYFDVAVMVRAGFFTKICCWLLPPLGAYFTSVLVRPYLKSVREELDGTFGNQGYQTSEQSNG